MNELGPTPRETPKSEGELIRRLADELALRHRLQPHPVRFGDDMAALDPRDPTLLWTSDMLMDGVDFESDKHSWRAIGRKALAVNLSDCAAMGVAPLSALCAVALENTLTLEDALELHRGAHDLGETFGCALAGGDTNSWSHPTVICISVAGRAPVGRQAVLRSGARLGDGIWLTGPLGGSILGRHMAFVPRVELGLTINRDLAPHAMIDISDGFAVDLEHILAESNCGAAVEETRLRRLVHADAQRLAKQTGRDPLEHALHDGEDFELIVVLASELDPNRVAALGLTRVGTIVGEVGLRLARPDGARIPIEPRGWEHFT